MKNPATHTHTDWRAAFLTGCLLALTLVATYWPGLRGPFVFDDGITIAENPAVTEFKFDAAGLSRIAHLDRPLAMATYALNWRFADPDSTFAYKSTNLFIHFISAGLVFWLTSLLIAARESPSAQNAVYTEKLAASAVAFVWALHPIQLTSVLYVVQRMTSLAACAVLGGLIAYLYGRRRIAGGRAGGMTLVWLGIVGGSVVGFGFKENAVLLLPLALVIEAVFFFRSWSDPSLRRKLLITYMVLAILLVALVAAWLVTRNMMPGAEYAVRNFSVTERLLTEPRVLWHYISQIILPLPHRFALHHDDIPISRNLFSPWSTGTALITLMVAVTAAVALLHRFPLPSFAVLWFLVGHSIESGFIGLEIAHEHRNYLPSLGPILALVLGALNLAAVRRQPRLRALLACVTVLGIGISTNVLAGYWKDKPTLGEFLVRHHPASARTHVMLADMYYFEKHDPLKSLWHYGKAAELAPYDTAYLIRVATIAAQTTIVGDSGSTPIVGQDFQIFLSQLSLQADVADAVIRFRPNPVLLERIATGLRTEPITHRTWNALAYLTRCATEGERKCRQLRNPLLAWHRLALANARIAGGIHTGLLLSLTSLQIDAGDLAGALDSARAARALEPQEVALALMEADTLRLNGRLSESRNLLLDLLGKPDALAPAERAQAEELLRWVSAPATPSSSRPSHRLK